MTSTEILKHEHKIILLVLEAAEHEVRLIHDTGKVHADRVEKMLDFFRNFADRCHHAKEENLLFMKMRDKGIPGENGPIAVMLKEHAEGRKRLKAVSDALPQAREGDASAIGIVKDNLSAYIELLRNHIKKEDNILYPMADQLFTFEDQKSLSDAFDKVEAEEMGAGVHEKYHQLAQELISNKT
jgi:hemerythrin-like domain-containing protein